MRFSSAQLRLLQDSLAPAVPELEPPPEMARPQPAPATAEQPRALFASEAQRLLFPAREREDARRELDFPLEPMLGLYLLGYGFLLLSASSSQDLSRQSLALSSCFLAPALGIHAMACASSRASWNLGLASSLSVYAVFVLTPPGICWPFLAVASLAAAFYLSSSRSFCVAVLPLSAVSVATAAAACLSPPQYRLYLWAVSGACLAVQALATAGPLLQFDLVCVLRPR